jgi:hypothetical protein
MPRAELALQLGHRAAHLLEGDIVLLSDRLEDVRLDHHSGSGR